MGHGHAWQICDRSRVRKCDYQINVRQCPYLSDKKFADVNTFLSLGEMRHYFEVISPFVFHVLKKLAFQRCELPDKLLSLL